MAFHNRTVTVIGGLFLVVILFGAGCAKKDAAPAVQPGGDASTGVAADAHDTSGITWTTYRSERLGIVIPYPEGWYVEEADSRLSLYVSQPPVFSDAPPRVSITRVTRLLSDEIATFPNPQSIAEEKQGNRNVKRVVFLQDAELPLERSVGYVWEERIGVREVIGWDGDYVVERIVDGLEVQP